MKHLVSLLAFTFATVSVGAISAEEAFCPKVYHKGVLELDINPAFLHVDEYNYGNGQKVEGLTVSSFYNMDFSTGRPFAADQVGLIMDIDHVTPDNFDFDANYAKLTDLAPGMPKTTWPNEAQRVPDGVLPFEAVVAPQGFHAPPFAGRLTLINLDSPNKQEYIVHQSTMNPAFPPGSPNNSPRFYHVALFHDMDGDGLDDIVTVRSGFKILTTVMPPMVYPPFSELVWFRNPGALIDPNTPWQAVVLYGGPFAGFMGPDIALEMYDFENDGVPEIVATHFFTGDSSMAPGGMPTKGKIAIYGAPVGGSWLDVNAYSPYAQPRVKVISDNRGFPFGLEIVDLNGDGQVEVLATNHQVNCTPYPTPAGQVYVLEPPVSGNIFSEEWPATVLLDGIRPQPNAPGARSMRMAPGHAITFYPKEKQDKPGKRPWIVVSGDQAGKVWIMKPEGDAFGYDTAVLFDINDYYGANTTQTATASGVYISTIGKPALRYDDEKGKGCKHGHHGKKSKAVTEIYIPVFEAMDIHVFSFDKDKGEDKVVCPADVTLSCTP
ncbi:MAG: hypothetical protein MUC50_14635 [Myxococcota bacterium]|jgi:hypothetical protein|nr:hypothetical protein [Myxococcota bacterium]